MKSSALPLGGASVLPVYLAFLTCVVGQTTAVISDEAIEIDTAAGEIRFPCRFLRAERQLEVFACHSRGPAHETVVVFDAAGPQLYDALIQIGCQPTDAWNVSSPNDFLRNQGERLVVLVRWNWDGTTHEVPAEALLLDGITGQPSFVRGFSFGAPTLSHLPSPPSAPRTDASSDEEGERPTDDRPETPRRENSNENSDRVDPGGDDPDRDESNDSTSNQGVPETVEITMGASQRQRAVFSLLTHPTALAGQRATPQSRPCRALQPWTFYPELNLALLKGLSQMLEEGKATATLIIRRLPSELDLVTLMRQTAKARGVAARAPLYDQLEPLARELDRNRRAYPLLIAKTRELLKTDLRHYPATMASDLAAYAGLLNAYARWLGARVQELYFATYATQAAFRLEELKKDKTLEEAVLKAATDKYQHGLRFEPLVAAQERRAEESELQRFIHFETVRALELERDGQIQRINLGYEQSRHDSLGADEDYLRELFAEEVERLQAAVQVVDARHEASQNRIDEAKAMLNGEWTEKLSAFTQKRQLVAAKLRAARLSAEINIVRREIRWERNDLSSELEDRKANAKKNLKALRTKEEKFRTALKETQSELKSLEGT